MRSQPNTDQACAECPALVALLLSLLQLVDRSKIESAEFTDLTARVRDHLARQGNQRDHRFMVLRNTSGRVKVAWASGAVPIGYEVIGLATSTTALGAYLAVVKRLPDDLDAKIKPLVLLLNLMGFLTVSSCGGHVEQGLEQPGSVAVIVQGLAQLRQLQALAADVFGNQTSPAPMSCDLFLQTRTDGLPVDWFRVELVFQRPQGIPTDSDYQWAVTQIGGWANRRGMEIIPLRGETQESISGSAKRVVVTWDMRPKKER